MRDLQGLYMVDVVCDDEVLPFYERLGFTAAHGAVVRDYGWRSAGSARTRTFLSGPNSPDN